TGAGIAVVGRFIRTPAGPSVNVSAGTPSRGTPGMNPTPISRSVVGGGVTPSGQPLTIPSFSSRVIACTSRLTRPVPAAAGLVLSGAAAPAGAGPATRQVTAASRTATRIDDLPRPRDTIVETSRRQP